MGYIDGSCYGDKVGHGVLPAQVNGWEIKERRGGGPLDEASMQAVVSSKGERRERGWRGSGTGGRGVGVESRPDAGEKEKRTVHIEKQKKRKKEIS